MHQLSTSHTYILMRNNKLYTASPRKETKSRVLYRQLHKNENIFVILARIYLYTSIPRHLTEKFQHTYQRQLWKDWEGTTSLSSSFLLDVSRAVVAQWTTAGSVIVVVVVVVIVVVKFNDPRDTLAYRSFHRDTAGWAASLQVTSSSVRYNFISCTCRRSPTEMTSICRRRTIMNIAVDRCAVFYWPRLIDDKLLIAWCLTQARLANDVVPPRYRRHNGTMTIIDIRSTGSDQ